MRFHNSGVFGRRFPARHAMVPFELHGLISGALKAPDGAFAASRDGPVTLDASLVALAAI